MGRPTVYNFNKKKVMVKLFSRTKFILTNRTIKINAKVIQFQHDVIKI